MPSISEPADSHILSRPRGRCRALRQEFRLKVTAGLLTAAAALAMCVRFGLATV